MGEGEGGSLSWYNPNSIKSYLSSMIKFLLDADGRHAVWFLADSFVLKASTIQFHSSHTTSKSKLSRMVFMVKANIVLWGWAVKTYLLLVITSKEPKTSNITAIIEEGSSPANTCANWIIIIITIPLFIFSSIYSTNSRGAEQMSETNNSNWT